MAFTVTWNQGTFETAPADSDNVSAGAGKFRELKQAVSERLNEDHFIGDQVPVNNSSDSRTGDTGLHRYVTLVETSGAAETPGANQVRLYTFNNGSDQVIRVVDEGGNVDELVELNQTQTLTNKTIAAPTFTGITTFADGSAAAPSITGTSTADDGLYFTTNLVGIASSGVGVLTVSAPTNLTDAVVAILSTEESTSPTTGALTIGDGLGVAGATWIGGLINVAGAGTIQGALTVSVSTASTSSTTGALIISGGLGVAKNLFIAGNVIDFDGTNADRTIQFASDASIVWNESGNKFVSDKRWTVSSTSDATSISTGSIETVGGVGITKALWVGGLVNIAGAVTLQSTTSIEGHATLASGIDLLVAVDGTSDLGTTGARFQAAYIDAATFTNNVTIGGTLGVTGLVTMNGGYTVNAETVDHIFSGSTQAIHRVTTYRNNTPGSRFLGRKARGTSGSPLDVVAGDVSLEIQADSYVNGAFDPNTAIIHMIAETVAGSVVSGKIKLSTMNTGGTITTALTIDDDQLSTFSGAVSIDDTTDSTSGTTGSLHTDGGLGVAKKGYFGDSVTIADGKGILTDSGGTGEYLATIVKEIGDWDMVADATVSVVHGITSANLRSISVLIRNDLGTTFYTLGGAASGDNINDLWIAGISDNVLLERPTGGFFDSTSFNATSFNRGWVTIIYAI